MNKKLKPVGFTLIELLVVIVIIGILTTVATVALANVRSKTRDTRRISDIKQIQTALELYFNDQQKYPTDLSTSPGFLAPGKTLTSPDGTKTYIGKVPHNPEPWTDGACSTPSDYVYQQINGGLSYSLGYCLGSVVNNLPAGSAKALPGILNSVSTNVSTCNDVATAPNWWEPRSCSSSVILSWWSVTGATSYIITRSGESSATFTLNPPFDPSIIYYTDSTVSTGKTYNYTIKAVVCGVNSPNSAATSVTVITGPCVSVAD